MDSLLVKGSDRGWKACERGGRGGNGVEVEAFLSLFPPLSLLSSFFILSLPSSTREPVRRLKVLSCTACLEFLGIQVNEKLSTPVCS